MTQAEQGPRENKVDTALKVRQRLLTWSFALSLGVLGTYLFHIALFSSGFELFPGDHGDARFFVYLAEHWYQVLLGHGELLSPAMFHPAKGTLGYTDTFASHGLPYSLLRAAGLDMFSALTVPIVLISFLNYLMCFILLNRAFHFSSAASCVGAMFFAFNSPKLNHPGHFNIQLGLFLPLAIILVVVLGRNAANLNQMRAFALLLLAALSVDLQLLTSLYPGWFFVFWSLLFVLLSFSFTATRAFLLAMIRRFWPAFIGGAALFLCGLLALALIYLPVVRSVGPRPYHVVSTLIPEFWSLLIMGDNNYVWGRVSAALWQMHRLSSTEHNIGIGLIASVVWLAISVWAIWMLMVYTKSHINDSRKRIAINQNPLAAQSDTNHLFLGVAILATNLFYLIGMKYWNGASPWYFVYRFIPGADGLRTVARYVIVLTLPMAIAFAFVMDAGLQKIARQKKTLLRRCLKCAVFVLVSFGLIEQFGRAAAFPKGAEIRRLGELAAKLPDNCSSFYVVAAPVRRPVKYEYQIDAMLVSVMRGVPTLNGYSAHVPPGWSLREVEAPGYEENVRKWITLHNLDGRICQLEVGE
jgi:hypothetical protein